MRLLPGAGAARRGMVPDAALSSDVFVADPALASARLAAFAGDWHPAAELLASTIGDWDRRTAAVNVLADVAPDERTWLRAWLADRPDDPDAKVMEAAALVAVAWQRRGSARSRSTTREQFGAFHTVLRLAETAAWQAAEAALADPTPWVGLISVAMANSMRPNEFAGIWAGVTERARHHRPGHTRALQYWAPKWSGTADRMLEFAAEAAAKSPSLSPLPLTAAFEAAMDGIPIWRSGYVKRALDPALAWLDGAGENHPATREDRAYAILALLENGRYDEAVAQFRLLGGHADAHVWKFSGDVRKAANPIARFAHSRALACRRAGKDA